MISILIDRRPPLKTLIVFSINYEKNSLTSF